MSFSKRFQDEHQVRLAAGLTGFALMIPAEQILSVNKRDHRIARARQVAMYLAHVALGMSLSRIANALGRDRSTVAYGCHRIEDFRDDPAIDEWLDGLEEQLRNAADLSSWRGGVVPSPRSFERMQLS
ncbi:MAG: helix-turn-helix domain-containing protein [Henriciella sp.]|uniref:helix-turn-helix domain-containing protein n=1 Tax=Henriciella sp. TaxID=1968823 RepID=UPI003C72BFB7